jgi:uncharacterized membrane protein
MEVCGMKLRSEIKEQAKKNFSAQYWMAVGAFVLYMLIVGYASGATGGIAAFFLAPPMIVGFYSFSLKIYRGQTADIGGMFTVGFTNYWRNVGGVLWMELFVFLWSLLFIIPGIIKALAYFMTPYILADSKSVAPTEAIKLSMRMTKGHKGKIFVMGLSFIGWAILTGLTCGILGIFYTGPYMETSFAGLYDELKKNALEKGIVTEQELV